MYLLGLWGLPETVVEAIAFHHRPSDFVVDGFSLLTAVHVAEALEHELRSPASGSGGVLYSIKLTWKN